MPTFSKGKPLADNDNFLAFYRPDMTATEVSMVTEVIQSGWLTTGPKVKAFEALLVESLDTESALALNSCTAGLHLGLQALEVQAGDEVITTPLTFCATANVVEHVGAKPVLADVDADTWQISPEAVEKQLTDQTKVLLPVHFAGQLAPMTALNAIAREKDLKVLEDAAHLFPDQRFSGRSKNLAAYSFYANKNITTGEGGALVGPSELVEKVRPLSLHGLSRDAWKRFEKSGSWKYDVEAPGFKYNMTDLQAALGLSQMERLEVFLERRKTLHRLYQQAFADLPEIQMMQTTEDYSYHLMSVIIDPKYSKVSRDQVIDAMKAKGIGTSVHYIPLFNFSFYQKKYGWRSEDYPNAKFIGQNCISLPFYTSMTEEDLSRVVNTLKSILTKKS